MPKAIEKLVQKTADDRIYIWLVTIAVVTGLCGTVLGFVLAQAGR